MDNDRQRLQIFLPNRVIWYLTFSDGLSWGSYYAIMALIGLFLSSKLGENVEQIIGFGFGAYLLTRSFFQLIIASIADKIKGLRDEVILLMLGGVLMGTPFIVMPFITTATQYYLLLMIIGLGSAMNLVGWRKLFAKNLDKDKEGMDYGIYDSMYSLMSAFLSVTAGLVANLGEVWFNLVVVSAGLLIVMSGLWAVGIDSYLAKHKSKYT